VDCPKCKGTMQLPPDHESSVARPIKETKQELYDAASKTLTCGSCDAEYDVGRYAPGREILCLGCEAILVVPSDHQQRRHRDKKKKKKKRDKTRTKGLPTADEVKREERKHDERKKTRKGSKTRSRLKPATELPAPGEKPVAETRPPLQQKGKKAGRSRSRPEREGRSRSETKARRKKKRRQKIVLCCSKCEYKFDVGNIEPGRSVMCPECEQLTVVPAKPVADAHMQSAGDLAVIEISASEETGAIDIAATRNAFSEFYEQEAELEPDDKKYMTRDTRVVETGEIDEILEPARRRTLEDVAMNNIAITPRESRREKPFPIFAVAGVVVLVPCLGLMVYLLIQSRQDVASKKYAKRRSEMVPVVAPKTVDPLKPGVRVEVRGVIRGGKGMLLAKGRCGFLLITRGSGDLWIEEPSCAGKRLFARFAQQHQRNQRITIKLVGVVRARSELLGIEGLPAVLKSHRIWIEVDASTIEPIGYGEYKALSNSLTVLK